jgi:CspA family cold shock protein
MAKGVVAWFSNSKGYGFIERKGEPDVFFHHTALMMEGYRTIEKGEHVEFDVDVSIENNKPIAVNVRKLEVPNGTASNPVH